MEKQTRAEVTAELGFFLDPILRLQLDDVKKKVIEKDFDFSLIIDGEVGAGKSVLAMQVCKYLDPNFSLNNICFDAETFITKLQNAPRFSTVLLDEAFAAASARGAMTEMNKAILAVAAEMRQRNLFVVFVIPSFFDLERPLALHRCKALIHVYLDRDGNRGQYLLFPKNQKKLLYLSGKKTYSYARPYSPYPPCQFKNEYIVDEMAYRKMKATAFRERAINHKESMRDKLHKKQRDILVKYLFELGTTPIEIANILDNTLTPIAIYQIVQRLKSKDEQNEING